MGDDSSNVESRSRIADRDRYYSGRGRKKRVLREERQEREREREREREKAEKGTEGKAVATLCAVLKSTTTATTTTDGRNTAETASPSSTRSAAFAKNFHN